MTLVVDKKAVDEALHNWRVQRLALHNDFKKILMNFHRNEDWQNEVAA
jgi:hypothetical protein